MLALCLALLAAALLLGVPQSKETQRAFGLALVGAAAVWLVLPRLSGLLARLGAVRVWVLLTLLCLLVKGLWVVLVRIPQTGDYATFWGYANSLAQSSVIDGSRYMALFPHIFGYASFLSWFIPAAGSGRAAGPGAECGSHRPVRQRDVPAGQAVVGTGRRSLRLPDLDCLSLSDHVQRPHSL